MTTPMPTTATYKGRAYRVLWQGQTRHGDRTKLGFLDGSEDFWVDTAALNGGPAPACAQHKFTRPGRVCRGCNEVA